MGKIGIGIIGCGNISGIYFKNCKKFDNLEILACADMVKEKAEAKAKEYNIPKACSVEELLADKRIKLVVNLTIPKAHTEVNIKALNAGKNVYLEKPLALSRNEAVKVINLARKKRLLVGGAPDTFMGSGQQACRKLIDDGEIGRPVGATAFMLCHGHESWHPAPEFYYKKGGGPMLDMGPYYLTALVNILGPAVKVMGMENITFPERTITSKEKYGAKIKVEVSTHVLGLIEFKNRVIGTIITSFDVWAHKMPCIEIYGEKGTLRVPDPNCFDGVPLIWTKAALEWKEVKLTHAFVDNSRGVGVSDMANAIINKVPFRPDVKLTYHVLDLMQSFHESARTGKQVKLVSKCGQPAPMPVVTPENESDWMTVGGK
ncbi:MAG: oxidoreductase [Elusimicrobia bacterium RIFOXYA2_FULL_39_19]|nr:MAG: oxidoreductase [Elusimicrobia bacterium RIFOXYA2_FULL_39_19]